MKIPKYVQSLIDRRCKLAVQLDDVCYKLDKWLDENNIECESCDTHTGVEIYCNPCSSKSRVKEAIINHPTDKHDVTDKYVGGKNKLDFGTLTYGKADREGH